MRTLFCLLFAILSLKAERVSELDVLWAEIPRSVRVGGVAGYKSTGHPGTVVISGKKKTSDAATTHKTGLFRYPSISNGETKTASIHFVAFLVKSKKWLVLMENQVSEGTQAEWDQHKK